MDVDVERARQYGFVWGQVAVARIAEVERPNGVYRVLLINDLEVYVAPRGRTRVFRKLDGRRSIELLPPDQKPMPEYATGECPICHKTFRLRKSGRLWLHGPRRWDGSAGCRGEWPIKTKEGKGAQEDTAGGDS